MSVDLKFSVPSNGESYSEFVFDRCEQLIDAKIWKSISIKDYNLWKNNFSGEAERYFAALVLDALIYRSREQTIASIQQAFHRTVYELGLDKEVDWIRNLAFGKDAGIRLVPVIKNSDPPTKSGTTILRIIKREFRFREDLMLWPWQVRAITESCVL